MSTARHVVERCPSCGVEHDVSDAGACEACNAPLRYWCRLHGRETGWLAGPACPRCAEDAVWSRPRPVPLTEIPERRVHRGLGPPKDMPKPVSPRRRPPPAPRPKWSPREDPFGALVGAVMMLLVGVAGGGLIGMAGGIVNVFLSPDGSLPETPLAWGVTGAWSGLAIAIFVNALAIFGKQAPPRE